ncbi:MAG: PIN domain-containing protein [Armatimonadetes bacterium]|nr:PIN domain-containing protein [Akkermansiaceae bacterium]
MSVLIDTSAWIDFLRNGRLKNPEVAVALETGGAVLCHAVWTELWSGLRGKREESVLMNIREACGWLEIDTSVWELAAGISRAARQLGLNCPLADVLIAACAKHHRTELLHRDKHFEALLKLCDKMKN